MLSTTFLNSVSSKTEPQKSAGSWPLVEIGHEVHYKTDKPSSMSFTGPLLAESHMQVKAFKLAPFHFLLKHNTH